MDESNIESKDESIKRHRTDSGLSVYVDTDESVTITKQEYDALKADVKFLLILMTFGVDGWEGYDQAMEAYRTSQDRNTAMQQRGLRD